MEIESSTTHGGAGWRSGGNAADVVEMDRDDKERQIGTWLVWEELTVVLPNLGHGTPRRLLQGLNGYAEPGRIMAVMGPSASGKSTLLDSLAGRLSRNVIMTGDILVNGKKRRLDYGLIAYVTQEDVLLGTLTVKETIQYSALLRLPTTLPKHELDTVVEDTIVELGLQDCTDRLIGNWHLRGISGGEKKRVSIALEILTKPNLLFLDEPTTGLDSASAFFVVQMLRNIAQDGRTVISSIHQPSSEVFTLFDDLFLLSGGETVYCGEAKMAVQFFAGAGFPCPSKRNPSDHFLRCINSDFDAVRNVLTGSQRFQSVHSLSEPYMNLATAEIKAMLIRKYTNSDYEKRVKARIRQITTRGYAEFELKSASQATWCKQLTTLTRRSLVNMSRDVGYYWLRMVIYLIIALSVGTVFYNVGYKYSSILARVACGGFISGFMTFLSIGGFPSFIEEMKVFYKERRNGYYGVGVYTLSNFLSSFPFLLAIGAVSGTITNYMVSPRLESGFSHDAFLCLDIFGCIAVIESLMMVVASLVPNYLMGVVIGAGIMGILMMTSGFFRLLSDLPKPFWRYPISYLNYGAWALQGGLKNDMLGLEFEPLNPGEPKLKGDMIITTMFGTRLDHSKWWDLAAVFGIMVAYRLLFFIILKLEERISPMLRRINAKQTLYLLEKSPFFKAKTAAVHSRRHQPRHALSSQEGLNSPLN